MSFELVYSIMGLIKLIYVVSIVLVSLYGLCIVHFLCESPDIIISIVLCLFVLVDFGILPYDNSYLIIIL